MKRLKPMKRSGFRNKGGKLRKGPLSSALSRINPVSKKRKSRSGIPGKLGIVRLAGEDMQKLRWAAFLRSEGRCEMQRDGERCGYPISFENSELAHIKSRGAGGSDVIDNVLMSCSRRKDGQPGCHHMSHNPKAVPAK